MYDYNTTRQPLILKEYGRNIQKLMAQLETIDDKTLRTQKSYTIVKLMEVINPSSASSQKRWDDLFILSDYTLDIDAPNPKPVKKEPSQQQRYVKIPLMEMIKYKYHGRHIESLLKKITTLPTIQEQEQLLITVGKLMRRLSSTWNNNHISTERIMENIERILPDGIVVDLEIIRTIAHDGSNGQKFRTKYHTTSIAAGTKNQ